MIFSTDVINTAGIYCYCHRYALMRQTLLNMQVQKQQHNSLKAYPELATLNYKENTKHVIRVSIDTVKSLGWELVNADVDQGIIEATDTTTWFGFKDDVVIRVVCTW